MHLFGHKKTYKVENQLLVDYSERRERDSKRRALAQARGDTLLAPDFSPIHQIHYPRNPPFVRITLLVQGQAGIAGYCFGLWQLELAQRMP